MTFRVKVNQPSGPRYYYALNEESLNDLLARLYDAGKTNAVIEARP